MASTHLRYLALRRRIAGLLADDPSSDVLTTLVRELYRALPHYQVITIFKYAEDCLAVVAVRGIELEAAAQLAGGLARTAAENRAPLRIPDLSRDQRSRPAYTGIVAELVVPISYAGSVAGVIDVQSDRPGALGPGDQDLLHWLGGQIGERVQISDVRCQTSEF